MGVSKKEIDYILRKTFIEDWPETTAKLGRDLMIEFTDVLKTAGKKQTFGKTRLDLIHPEAIEGIGLALTDGCKKYGDNNWRLGLKYSEVYGAAQRHLQKFWSVAISDIDKDSGLPHLYHAICNIAFLLTYEENKERYQTFDDRAGSNNEFYKQQEGLVKSITKLVQENPGFFECQTGDDLLQKVYDTLDYAINTSQQFPDQPDFPDLTKMTHPEACEHLVEGMRVKLMRGANAFELDWSRVWINEMTAHVGGVYTIESVDSVEGIHFEEIGCWYPAFVLEIISRPGDTE
jgi:hypothetical protein